VRQSGRERRNASFKTRTRHDAAAEDRAGALERRGKAVAAERLAEFHARNAKAAPAALERLKRVVIENGNVFAELMKTVRVCSLGQITKALFEVGGEIGGVCEYP
jgi:methylmalonyl-CoA mutase